MFVSPGTFIGQPDWRSALLAAVYVLPWLLLLCGKWLKRPWPWLALAAGAMLFPFTIAWIQVPLQGLYSKLLLGTLDVATIQRWLLLLSIPSLVIGSLVQEGAKLLVAWGALRLARAGEPGDGLALGAAAGAGYGGFEAFWTFNSIFATGLTWGTIQLGGVAALLGFIERVTAVAFHTGSGALLGYGVATRRPWRFFLLTVALHTLGNLGVVLMQLKLLNAWTVEAWVAVPFAVTMGLALWLRFRRS
jgi:uncharacterized membrane protein YhfC